MGQRDPQVFGRNVRVFRALRGWSIRDLAARAGVSSKTIIKIERGQGCAVRTEYKIALGLVVYVGRLWDADLFHDEPQRVIRKERGRWFFADVSDAERYHERMLKVPGAVPDERFRSDPDLIQGDAERERLGRSGLSRGFIRTLGGALSTGYYAFNVGELYDHDSSHADSLNHTYLCICARGSIRFGIRDQIYELAEGDAVVFADGDAYWMEPVHPVAPTEPPPIFNFVCLNLLKLKN